MTQLAVAVSLNQSLNKTSQRDAVNCAPAGGVRLIRDAILRYRFTCILALLIFGLAGCSTFQSSKNKGPYCHEEDSTSRLPKCSWNYLKSTGKKEAFEKHFKSTARKVLNYYQAPIKDGNKYSGEITFCTNRDGVIDNILLTRPSGHTGMDNAFIEAIRKTRQVPVPSDECLADKFYFSRVRFNYNETYMAEK